MLQYTITNNRYWTQVCCGEYVHWNTQPSNPFCLLPRRILCFGSQKPTFYLHCIQISGTARVQMPKKFPVSRSGNTFNLCVKVFLGCFSCTCNGQTPPPSLAHCILNTLVFNFWAACIFGVALLRVWYVTSIEKRGAHKGRTNYLVQFSPQFIHQSNIRLIFSAEVQFICLPCSTSFALRTEKLCFWSQVMSEIEFE